MSNHNKGSLVSSLLKQIFKDTALMTFEIDFKMAYRKLLSFTFGTCRNPNLTHHLT